jgi:phosphodiester glycosidase
VRLLPVGLLAAALPVSTLSVWTGERWAEWWRSSDAPATWSEPVPVLAGSLQWRRIAQGVEWSEARLSGVGEARRIRLIVARIDPRLVRFRLDTAFRKGRTRADWTIARSPKAALVTFNAGQFASSMPWGWTVLGGREFMPPRSGPLSVAVAFDTSGRVRWLNQEALRDPRRARGVAAAFQSYPRLLDDGSVPLQLRTDGAGIDVAHRDARLALGQAADGMLLIALTRFDGGGELLDFLPFGLTVPEMAAIMGGLGARNAVLLDGGISSQLLIREAGTVRRWRGLRPVPLGLSVLPR